jgi:molybdopterin converting factor small subunit
MKIRVLYFAAAREIVGRRDESVAVRDGTSVGELSAELIRLHPPLRRLGRSVRFSVNLEVVDEGVLLRDSDVFGVLPPVAGG